MKKSKLAIASFVLSFLPIIIPIFLVFGTLIFGRPPGATITMERLLTAGSYLSLMSLFMTIWFAIISIILGTIALIKIKGNNLKGKWFAVTGIVISVIFVIMTIVFGFVISWSS